MCKFCEAQSFCCSCSPLVDYRNGNSVIYTTIQRHIRRPSMASDGSDNCCPEISENNHFQPHFLENGCSNHHKIMHDNLEYQAKWHICKNCICSTSSRYLTKTYKLFCSQVSDIHELIICGYFLRLADKRFDFFLHYIICNDKN